VGGAQEQFLFSFMQRWQFLLSFLSLHISRTQEWRTGHGVSSSDLQHMMASRRLQGEDSRGATNGLLSIVEGRERLDAPASTGASGCARVVGRWAGLRLARLRRRQGKRRGWARARATKGLLAAPWARGQGMGCWSRAWGRRHHSMGRATSATGA
jgi:hypothetical protein